MKKRIASIDLLKVLGITIMVAIHMAMYLLRQPTTAPEFYNIIGVVFMNTMSKIAQLAAPLFLTAVGINLTISIKNRNKKSKPHIIKRSIFLIILGLLFINIWQADILHFIGVFLLITYFLLPLSKYIRAAIIAIILSTYGYLLKLVDYNNNWEIIAFKLANFWTLKGFFENLLLTGFHPILPWITFVIAGTIIGSYLIEARQNKKENKFSLMCLISGILLSTTGLIMNFTWKKITFYPASISYVIFYIGLSIIIFSTSFYILDIKNKFKKLQEQINFLGSVSLSFYILHVIIGIVYFRITSSLNNMIAYALFVYILIILTIIYIICYISKQLIGDGPIEYLMKKIIKPNSPNK